MILSKVRLEHSFISSIACSRRLDGGVRVNCTVVSVKVKRGPKKRDDSQLREQENFFAPVSPRFLTKS